MRDDLEESIEDSIKEMLSDIKEMKEKDAEHHKEVSDRLTKLEMWKWYVIGMATLAGFIFSLLPDFIT